MNSFSNVLVSYANAYRDLVNSVNSNTKKTIKQSLRLNKDEDWYFICTAMDIVGDALLAIDNFLQFGLDGPTRYKDTGEKYLRLYGALNATYIQQQAIHNLFKLNNVPHPKKAKDQIEKLKIREARHKLGAHSNDYLNRNKKIVESFVPVRVTLSGFNCEYYNNETLKKETLNLKKEIEEHLSLMIDLLDKTYEKAIKTFHKSNRSKIKELNEKLEDLRIMKEGGMVIKSHSGKHKIIFTTIRN